MRDLEADFARWWADAGAVGSPGPAWAALQAAWSSPGRAYHTLAHLSDCLDVAAPFPDPRVRGALFFHDAVYDVHAHDNEARSAGMAEQVCTAAGISCAPEIAALVRATAHAAAPEDPLAALVVDIDLSILGRDAATFDRYEADVRTEYAWVPDAAFAAGRAAILEGLLARPRLYTTPHFAHLEAPARANLLRSLARLRA